MTRLAHMVSVPLRLVTLALVVGRGPPAHVMGMNRFPKAAHMNIQFNMRIHMLLQ